MINVENFVEEAIANNGVVIFSKSGCPFCAKSKYFFDKIVRIKYLAIELEDHPDQREEILEYLGEKTGLGSVPNIFIAQEIIGDSWHLYEKWEDGKLYPLLDRVRGH